MLIGKRHLRGSQLPEHVAKGLNSDLHIVSGIMLQAI